MNRNLNHTDLISKLEAAEKRIADLERDLEQKDRILGEFQQTEHEFQERERKFNKLLEILPVGISILDAEQNIVFSNPALKTILQINQEGLLNGIYKDRKYLAADGAPMPADGLASLQAEKRGEPVHNVETGIVKEDGEVIWTNVSATPVDFSDWKIVLTTTDITARKYAEEQQQKSEERFSNIFHSSPVPMVIGDAETGQIIDVNKAYEQLVRYDRDEIVGRTPFELDIYADEEQIARAMHDIHTQGSLRGAELTLRTKSNELRNILSWSQVIRLGNQQMINLGTALDVTGHKLVEQSLRENEARYRSLFENSPVAIWEEDFSAVKSYLDDLWNRGVTDLDEYLTTHEEAIHECVESVKVTDVNQAALIMYEASSKAELLGSLGNTFPGEALAGFKNELLRVAKGELGFHAESFVRTFHGHLRNVIINWIVPPGYEQTYAKVLVTLLDVTDLRQAQEKYKDIFENSAEGLFQSSPEGRFLQVNPAMARIYGYSSPQQMIGSITDIARQIYVEPHDREQFTTLLATQDSVVNFEMQNHRKDSSIIWTSTSARAVRDANGRILYYEGFLQDITERKGAQHALEENEKRFRALIENGLDDISLLDAQGQLLWESPAVVRNLGYAPEEYLGRDLFNLVHPEDRGWTNELFAKLIHEPESRQYGTFRLQHANGSWHWVEAVATNLLDEPSVGGVVINYRDITERKQAEEARHEAELRYRALFEQSHDAIFILDLEGHHLAVNQRAADMLGYTREELISLSAHELSAEPGQSQQVLQRLLNGERLPLYERLFRKKDGSTISVEINVELVHDTHGYPLHIQSVVRDITNRRQAEIELQHRNEDLGLINAINEVIVQGGTLDMVIDMLAKEMRHIFSTTGVSLYTLSRDERWLTMQHFALPSELKHRIEKLIGSTVPMVQFPITEGGVFHKVLRSGQGTITSGPKEIQNWLGEFTETTSLPTMVRSAMRKLIPQLYKLLNMKSTIIIPLRSNGNTIGALNVSSSDLFTADDLKRIEHIGVQLTAAIQRQQANERIQRSEEFLNSIQNALSASIAILDESGTIVRVNTAWRKFGEQNGLSHSRAGVGMNYLDVCDSASGPHSEEASLVARSIRDVIVGHRKAAWVEYPCHSPAEKRWFVLSITKFEDGDKIWVVLAHENITERREAQEAIQRSAAILAQAGNMAHLGAWEIDISNPENLNENPQHWSDEVYRIYGYEPGQLEVTADLFLELVHPDDRQKVQKAMSQAIAEKKPYEVEHRIIRPNGAERVVEERADLIYDQQGRLIQILGAVQDITERKLTEQTLRETSEQFRTLFEASPEAIMLVDPQGNWPILDCNATACMMNGYTREELVGRTIDILTLTPGDAAGRLEYLEQVREAGILRYDDFHRRKDGSIFPIETSTSIVTLGGREVILGIDRDITERKKAEDALRQSEQRYRALFEDMPVAIWEEDFSEVKTHLASLRQQGITDIRAYFESHPEALLECAHKIRILDVNNTAVQMYHAKGKEPLLRNLEGEVSETDLKQLQEVLISISEGQLSLHWEGPDETFTGEQIEINLAASVTPGHEEDYSRIIFTTVDITERKQVEETLRKERARAQNYLDIAGVLMLALDQTGTVTMINQKGCEMLGYNFAEIIGKAWIHTFVPEANRDQINGVFRQLMNGEHELVAYYESPVLTSSGEERLIAWHNTPVRDSDGKVISTLSSGEDITERKQMEARLQESEARYRLATLATKDVIWEWKLGTNQLLWTENAEFTFGYSPHEIGPDESWWETHIHPEDHERVLSKLNTAMRRGDAVLLDEYRLLLKDGSYAYVSDHGYIERDPNGQPIRMIGALSNITERKKAEDALRESEEKYRLLFESNPLSMWIYDLETLRFLKVNEAAIDHYGYSEAEFRSMTIKDIRPAEDVTKLLKNAAQVTDGIDNAGVWQHIKKDGSLIQVEIISHVVRFDGRRAKLVLVNDISERIRAEEALHESELKYRNLVETSHDLIWAIDGEGLFTYLNQASKQIYGYEPEELIGHSYFEIMHPNYQANLDEFRESIANTDKFVDYEVVVRHRDGRPVILSANSLVLRDENNSMIGMIGTSRDITERKQAEENLRHSENRYRLATKATNDVIWEWDATTHELIWSENAQVVFGYSAEEIGPDEKWWDQHLHPDDVERILSRLNDIMSGEGTIWSEEYRFLRKDGSYAHISDKASIERDADGNPLRMIGAMSDITDRKQVEEQLRKLSRAVEQSASTIVITDTKGQIEYVNPKFTEITGYTFEEALGQNPRILKSGLTPPQEYERLWKAITSGEDWHGELLNRKKNGELYWESVTISPILNARSETTHFIAVKEDITERKQNEAETRRRADEFAVLYETARDLAVQYHLPTLLNTIVERACMLLHTPGGGIYLYDEARDDLEMVLTVGSPIPSGARLRMGEGMAGRVAQTQQRLIVDDYHIWAGRSPQFESIPIKAVLQVPMLYGGKVIGVLLVHEFGESERKFTEVDAHLLSLFAEYAASAVHAARLLQETRRRAEETAALLETSVALTSLDLDSILQTFGEHAQSLFDADGCRIFLMEPDGETLRCVLALQETPEAFSDLRIKLGVGVTGGVAASGQAEIVNEMQNDPRSMQIMGTPDEEEAIMFAPLKERDRTIGVLSVRRLGTQRPFRPSDLVLLEALASMAASAVSNAHLFEETQRRLAELEALYENGLAVGRLLEPQAIGERIIQTFSQYLSWHHVTIRLRRDQSDELELVAFHLPHMIDETTNNEEQRFKTHVSRVGQGISGWVVQTGKPIRTSNLSEDPHYVNTYEGMQSGLYMPLKVGDRVMGVISVESDEREAFSEQDERLLATLANQAATAFENARLYQAAQQEIWDRRIAEEALRQSEEDYRRLARELEERVHERTAEVQDLYDNAPCGYLSLDQDGRIVRINQTQLKWLGYPTEEALGHSVLEFITDESRIAFRDTFPIFKQQGSLKDFELEMLRSDGSIFPVLVSATAIYDNDGRYLTSRSTLFDDTDRKQAMETLRLANSEMKRAMRMKDEFLANMSHELRTPLNAILGLSESLLEQTAGPINEKQHKYLGTVNESGRHLLELINDILDLAKIESGQIKLDPGKVNINTVCDASLRMIKQLAQKKHQTVEVQIENEIGHVWADERRLKQMMVNLLSNAVKFTPSEGQLGLRVRVDHNEMKLLMTVWDHGIGIRDEDLKRLFRPFVQLDSSLSRESAGTGLGLALVAEMARLHGGSISVSSQPGQGSEFTIILPWDPAITTETLERLKISSKIPIMKRTSTEKQTILLVEDTESVVLLLRDYLELAGYKVEIARDGLDGFSKSLALRPDLILMDVQMPGMDGLEATRRIRRETSLKDTPIIALTALAMTSDRERCLEAGMNDYLSKPINLKELAKAVLRQLADSGTGTKS